MPPRKKPKRESEQDPPLLLSALLSLPEHRGNLFPFLASSEDLCALDLVNHQFKAYTEPFWEEITMKRFGLSNGKAGWRKGTSLLRRPKFFELANDGNYGLGSSFAGSAHMATNDSILVAVSDDIDYSFGSDDRRFPVGGSNPISFRDARTLNYIRSVPSLHTNWKVAICGREGAEIIVTADNQAMTAFQGNRTQQISSDLVRPRGFVDRVRMLGCETHLFVIGVAEVFVFQAGADPLLTFIHSVEIPATGGRGTSAYPCWTARPNHFAFDTGGGKTLRVWNLDTDSSLIEQVKVVELNDVVIKAIAVGERYIAACCGRKKIHIYDYNTGEKQHSDLCDVDDDRELEDYEVAYPLSMVPIGDLLVSSSHIGHALCVWHMKTGELLKRYTHAFRRRASDQLPDGCDVSAMLHLKHLPVFICMAHEMYVWAFPDSNENYQRIKSIQCRERWSRRYQSSDDDSSDDEGNESSDGGDY